MKQINDSIVILASAFLALSLFAGCKPVTIEPVLPVSREMPDLVAGFDPATRLTTDAQGKSVWDENDGLTVFVAPAGKKDVQAYRYAVKDAGKGIFEARQPESKESSAEQKIEIPDGDVHDWYVMSPYTADQVKNPFGQPGSEFSLDGQIQDCNDSGYRHLTEFDLMTGVAEGVSVGVTPELHLSHQVTLMRLELKNGSDMDLDLQSVTFEAPEGKALGGTYFVDYKTGLVPALESSKVTLKLLNARLGKGETLPVFMTACPFVLNAGEKYTVTVVAKEQIWSQEYEVTGTRSFAKGQLNQEKVLVLNGSSNSAFPNLLTVKTTGFSGIAADGNPAGPAVPVEFAADHQLNVFLEKEGDASIDWEKASHRYITSTEEVAGGVFRAETGIMITPEKPYNAYIMSPFSQTVTDPVGGGASRSRFSLDGQVQYGGTPSEQIRTHAVMTGVMKKLTSGQQGEAVLEHKTALLHLLIPNESRKPSALQSLELTAPEGMNIGGTYSVDFTAGGNLTPAEASNHLHLQVEDPVQVAGDGMIEAYLVIPPVSLIRDDHFRLRIHTTAGNWEKRITIAAPVEIKAGGMYEFTVDQQNYQVDHLWTKTAVQQSIWHKVSGAAVNDRSVAVQTWGNDGETHFILCDRETGAVQKRVKAPWNYLMRVRTDGAGHFVVNRANYYRAGLHIWVYDQDKDEFKQLQWYDDAAGCPAQLGLGFNVCGDLTKGLSHVYATAPGTAQACHFSFRDGNRFQAPNNPEVLDFPSFGNWTLATIQRWSIAKDSGFYYSFYEHSKIQEEARAGFGTADCDWSITPSPSATFMTKILDAQVIKVGKRRLLLTDEQEYADNGASFLRIYDLSEGAPVLLHQSQGPEVTNFNHWGNVGAWVEETADTYLVYIAVADCGETGEQSNVRMYQMRWNKIAASDQALDAGSPDWNPSDPWMN